MQSSLRKGSAVAAGAAAIAFVGELLVRGGPPGLGFALTLALCAPLALWLSPPALRRARLPLVLVAVALASVFVLRGESLLWLATLVALLATGVATALTERRWLRDLEPERGVAAGLRVARGIAIGVVPLAVSEVEWRRLGSRRAPVLSEGARGALLALPVLVPFALLFLSADAVFAELARRVVDLPELASHLALWAVLAWPLAGWAREVAVEDRPAAGTPGLRLSGVEASAGLGLLLLLFASFVAVQLRYFFGGEALIRSVTDLSYAEYARRGFFELVAVAALLLVVLLLVDWLTRDAAERGRRAVRWLSLGLLALLAVILASALQRMRLYTGEYGLTELRFFTTAFMLWLVAVFGWYALTVLRGRRGAFAGGLYISGVAAVLTLAVLDPVGWIARENVRRAQAGQELDARYLTALGPNAVPVLAEALPTLPAVRCAIAKELVQDWGDPTHWDVRSWNLARARARDAVQAQVDEWAQTCPDIQRREG